MDLLNIARDTYQLSVNVENMLFEGVWEMPKGVSLNTYIIKGEKTAIVDGFCGWDGVPETLFALLSEMDLSPSQIDYLIINHMEPDHSGSMRLLRQYYPDVVLVGNSKTLSMVEGFYGVTDKTLEIKDEDSLNLGKHKLQFFLTPMVHWPETMMTYDITSKVLFSGDAFGSFGTLDGTVMDTDMHVDRYWDEMIRYYANIVGKYGAPVQKALQKLTPLSFETICSTHGPVWHKYIAEVVDMYDQLSRYEAKPGLVIVYGSMYGNTELMAETVAQGAAQAGVKDIIIHNVSKSDSSVILRDIFKYNGFVVGSPTYCNELYPEVDALLRKIEIRGIKTRQFGYFGSFTWAGAAVKRLSTFVDSMKWPTAEISVEEKQGLKTDNYQACLELGRQVGAMIKKA